MRPCAVPGLLQRIGELERDLEGLRGEVQRYCAEQESSRNQLAQKAKVSGQPWGGWRAAGTGTAGTSAAWQGWQRRGMRGSEPQACRLYGQ